MRWERRRRRKVPGLNTTATADISFILLAFFLMVSSIDSDKGLPVVLPAAEQTADLRDIEVKESDVLRLTLDAADSLSSNGTPVDAAVIKSAVKSSKLILISTDNHASYDAYFRLQHTIAEAYLDVRNAAARETFGHDYRHCSEEERTTIDSRHPWRVSEQTETGTDNQGGLETVARKGGSK